MTTCAHTHMHAHPWAHTHTHTRSHTHIHSHTVTLSHTRTHSSTRTHTHTRNFLQRPGIPLETPQLVAPNEHRLALRHHSTAMDTGDTAEPALRSHQQCPSQLPSPAQDRIQGHWVIRSLSKPFLLLPQSLQGLLCPLKRAQAQRTRASAISHGTPPERRWPSWGSHTGFRRGQMGQTFRQRSLGPYW